MADQTSVAEPPIKRGLAAPAYEPPRWRWRRLVVPFFLLAIGIAAWRTDPQTWSQLRASVLAVVQPPDDGRTTSDSHYAPPADDAFAAKGEIDVDGGLVKLFPSAYGEIESVPVHENDHVNEGAVLLRVRNRAAALQVDEATHGVELAAIELDKAKQAPDDLRKQTELADLAVQGEDKLVAIARRNLDHLRSLSQDIVNQESIRNADDAVVVAQQRLDAKRLERDRLKLRRPQDDVRTAEATLARAKTKLAEAVEEADRYVLKARSSGRIVRVNANIGETLGPASREPAVLFCPDKPWIVRCEIEQEFSGRVRAGAAVEVRDDATGEKVAAGVVDRVSTVFATRRLPIEDTHIQNDLRTMECTVLIKSNPDHLKIGQSVRAIFNSPGVTAPPPTLPPRKG